MPFDNALKHKIRKEFVSVVERTIARLSRGRVYRPFHEALLSNEAIVWSAFERSFSTSFGQSTIERLSALLAESSGAKDVTKQKLTSVQISQTKFDAITAHIEEIRHSPGISTQGWESAVESVLQTQDGKYIGEYQVISDLYFVREGIEHCYSIKTAKPNLDQAVEAKRDMLKLICGDSDRQVFLGFYYNPFGLLRSDYNWGVTSRVFNLQNDQCVLIGEEYWNSVAGFNAFGELLAIAEEVGQVTRKLMSDSFGI